MSNLESLLNSMASVNDPFELFEPYLWYDKLGDSCWKCEIRTTHSILWYGEGNTPLEAAERCYAQATAAPALPTEASE